MRLLIAEDQQDLNRLIAKILEKEGYGVDACFDGQEALYYLENTEYDAVILDMMMPKKKRFRSSYGHPQSRQPCTCHVSDCT